MWWVLINGFKYSNVADFRLFDATAEDFDKRRMKEHRIPEIKRKELDFLKSIPKGALIKLLAKKTRNSGKIEAAC